MQVELKKPELEQFIDAQVRAGRFLNVQDAIEAAVEQMRQTFDQLDDETIAAIAKADQQYASGEYVQWRDVKNQMRSKYLGK